MFDLILIGTVHLDPEGRKDLYKIIENLRPGILTVEISKFSVRYRLSNQGKWLFRLKNLIYKLPKERRIHSRLKLLELQLHLPFEWEVAYRYSNINNIPCLAIDSGNLARNELPLWENEVLSRKNLLKITDEPDFDLDNHFSECHSQAKIALKTPNHLPKPMHHLSWPSDKFWERREKTLAYRIRRIHGSGLLNPGSYSRTSTHHVHICGWMHLIARSPWKTLTDLLSDLTPMRILLTRMRNRESNHLII
ncbi:MAG: hypothetical protein LWX01_10500 [Deltaproteobacteria bacterium]|nr:hypothetical protein [Deltaproteobacteria bacterium]MDL1962104.1 hypothetical protein [Deltaproteobacteria bacterium]